MMGCSGSEGAASSSSTEAEGETTSTSGQALSTYKLVCRGGAGFGIRFNDTQPYPVKGLSATFTKASTKANANGSNLKSGQCSWTDRALNSQEPAAFALPNAKMGAVYWTTDGKGSALPPDTYLQITHPVVVGLSDPTKVVTLDVSFEWQGSIKTLYVYGYSVQ